MDSLGEGANWKTVMHLNKEAQRVQCKKTSLLFYIFMSECNFTWSGRSWSGSLAYLIVSRITEKLLAIFSIHLVANV